MIIRLIRFYYLTSKLVIGTWKLTTFGKFIYEGFNKLRLEQNFPKQKHIIQDGCSKLRYGLSGQNIVWVKRTVKFISKASKGKMYS